MLVNTVPISRIAIGTRRRDDYGDIAGLARSINTYGLLHPIVLDDERRLIAGERRLQACVSLGWESIQATELGSLTDTERAEIELEENLKRKDLTPYEVAKELVRKAQTVAPIISSKLEEKDSRGRKSTREAPKRAVAEAIGSSTGALVRAEQHVAAVEAHPALGGPGWKPSHVLGAQEALDRLPEQDRAPAVALVSKPGIPPKDAVGIVGKLASMPAPERARIYTLAASPDTRDHSLAVTEASQMPAMPDPRVPHLMDAVESLKKAHRLFPDDPLTERIAALLANAKEMLSALKEAPRGRV